MNFIQLRDAILRDIITNLREEARESGDAILLQSVDSGIGELKECRTVQDLEARVEDRKSIEKTILHFNEPKESYLANNYTLLQLALTLDIVNAGRMVATSATAIGMYLTFKEEFEKATA